MPRKTVACVDCGVQMDLPPTHFRKELRRGKPNKDVRCGICKGKLDKREKREEE